MPSFVDVITGALAKASDVQQIIDALKGTAGKGIPLSLTSVNDAINFALSVKNNDATASKTAVFYKADGTVLFQIDKNGVIASADGTTSASQIPTLTGTQTLTNKTLTNPVVSGAGAAAVGTLGFSGTSLLVGDGTVIENVGPLGAWTAFTPTLTQGVALTLSTATGRYMQIGKLVIAQVDIVVSGAGTAGQSIVLGALPVNARTPTGGYVLGHGRYFDGTTRYTAELMYGSATTAFLQSHNVANLFGITPAVTAANTHQLAATLMYEAA